MEKFDIDWTLKNILHNLISFYHKFKSFDYKYISFFLKI
jgi:hypothetical protein